MELKAVLFYIAALCNVAAQADDSKLIDTHENCEQWANDGECDANSNYMRRECARSCHSFDEDKSANADVLAIVKSFFDLEALDIDKNMIDFSAFKGKVTIVVNVASFCGYTKSHYQGLVQLDKDLRGTDMVEIIAFPCNQFGAQEPDECPAIKIFAQSRGAEFRMMDKINVNGIDTHPVYRFLKQNAGPAEIQWNFATYYVIAPDGTIASHSGVEPYQLKDIVLGLVNTEEL